MNISSVQEKSLQSNSSFNQFNFNDSNSDTTNVMGITAFSGEVESLIAFGAETLEAGSTTTRVSVGTGGIQSNGYSYAPSISANGRYVAFWSSASNLVSGDTNNRQDLFVYDTVANTTRRLSVGTGGSVLGGYSYSPSISADGRYVAFESNASTGLSGDYSPVQDIYVYDTVANTTRRVSVGTDGTYANSWSYSPSISAGLIY